MFGCNYIWPTTYYQAYGHEEWDSSETNTRYNCEEEWHICERVPHELEIDEICHSLSWDGRILWNEGRQPFDHDSECCCRTPKGVATTGNIDRCTGVANNIISIDW